jgi:hypothetical protein
MKTSLKRRTIYLIKRSEDGLGVGHDFISRYRKDVLELGLHAFNYLEEHLDARDGSWRVSGNFSWKDLK